MPPKTPELKVETLPPLNRKSVKSGLLTLGAVDENEMPESGVRESVNFHFDAIGSATLRPGETALGGQLDPRSPERFITWTP